MEEGPFHKTSAWMIVNSTGSANFLICSKCISISKMTSHKQLVMKIISTRICKQETNLNKQDYANLKKVLKQCAGGFKKLL